MNEKENLIFYILQEKPDKDTIDSFVNKLTGEDWEKLFSLANSYGIFPAFYNGVINLKIANIPEDLNLFYKGQFLNNLYRNLLFEQEVFEITEHLNKSDIKAVFLKGTVLAEIAYKDLALRRFSSDLDIVISYDKIKEVEEILLKIDYSFLDEPERVELLHKYRKEISLRKIKSGFSIPLDLHWDFYERFDYRLHVNEFLKNSKEIVIKGHKILSPPIEEIILFLTTAAIAYFEFVTVKYIYDIHKLITSYKKEIDWLMLVDKAIHLKRDTALYYSLKISGELFKTEISEEIFSLLSPSFIKEKILIVWINKNNILYRRHEIAHSYVWRILIYSYLYSHNLFDFMRLVYRRIFPPQEEVSGLIYNKNPGDKKTGKFLYIKRLLKAFLK